MSDPKTSMPRPEYPRPSLRRERWTCLNGLWQAEFDPADRGLRDGWHSGRPLAREVRVPFAPGCGASGWPDAPSDEAVLWYRREVELGADALGPRTLLHVGACDYEAQVFANGREVGRHRGGYAPLELDATHALRAGRNEIVLRVEDRATWTQPRGKQAAGVRSPVDYDPLIGIWQSVWLEPVPEVRVGEVWTRWHAASRELDVHLTVSDAWDGSVDVELRAGGESVAREAARVGGRLELRVPLRVDAPRGWSPADPFLYELEVTLRRDDRVVDRVTCDVGLRELRCEGGRILLDDRPLFLRGVLDQGYFPDGWYTAATDTDLRRDVELTLAAGFNCARKHQKAEDPRYLYWADRLGLLVWSEMPSGRQFSTPLVEDLTREWGELVRRDRGHASVMAWVPFNESWGVWRQAQRPEQRAFVDATVALTRALDPTRPVVGNDGWEYSSGDLWTLHVYEGEGEGGARSADAAHSVGERLRALIADPGRAVQPASSPLGERLGALPGADPSGKPIVLSECGGVGFAPPGSEAAGLFAYGDFPKTLEALDARFVAVADALRDCPELTGFVWTQLTDVQQETNGVFDFERRPKLPLARLREIFAGIGPSSA